MSLFCSQIFVLWLVHGPGHFYAIDTFDSLNDCKKAKEDRNGWFNFPAMLVCVPKDTLPVYKKS